MSIENDQEIALFLTRPQSAPLELSRGLLDIAIVGDDWIIEETSSGKDVGIIKIGDLGYGQTRLVVAIPSNSPYKSLTDFFIKSREKPVLCFTEYVNITRKKFMENEGYKRRFGKKSPLIQIRGLTNGENDLVQIINSDGVTEGYITKGADIVVDNSQSGKTLKEYGLIELEQIMESSVGLYAGPTCIEWKETKAGEIFEQLRGAVIGKKYSYVMFNIPNKDLEDLKFYLTSEGLCFDEPTVIRGNAYASVHILIPKFKFPLVLRTLKEDFDASGIVRIKVTQVIR